MFLVLILWSTPETSYDASYDSWKKFFLQLWTSSKSFQKQSPWSLRDFLFPRRSRLMAAPSWIRAVTPVGWDSLKNCLQHSTRTLRTRTTTTQSSPVLRSKLEYPEGGSRLIKHYPLRTKIGSKFTYIDIYIYTYVYTFDYVHHIICVHIIYSL